MKVIFCNSRNPETRLYFVTVSISQVKLSYKISGTMCSDQITQSVEWM